MTAAAVAVDVENRRENGTSGRPLGPRGTEAARTLARMLTGRPLEACAALFARYGDTVYLPVRLGTLRPAGSVRMRLTRRR